MRGVSLAAGQVVALTLNGTVVLVEDVKPTHLSVVALPDQPATRDDDRVFEPGRVGAKKISPFSSGTPVSGELSQSNQDFLRTYLSLRTAKGPSFIFGTSEAVQAAPVAVQTEPRRAGSRYKVVQGATADVTGAAANKVWDAMTKLDAFTVAELLAELGPSANKDSVATCCARFKGKGLLTKE